MIYPVVWGMYERKRAKTDHMATRLGADVLDVRRSIDYLETRAEIDHTKLAYFGFSAGALRAPILLATEPRIKVAEAAVTALDEAPLPQINDPFQFALRVHVPVLMMNGRYDLVYSVENSEVPLRVLGTHP